MQPPVIYVHKEFVAFVTDVACVQIMTIVERVFYKMANQDHSNACILCPKGFYQDSLKQTSCLPCIPSTYASMKGSKTCTSCSKNTYSDKTGRTTQCDNCKTGRHETKTQKTKQPRKHEQYRAIK